MTPVRSTTTSVDSVPTHEYSHGLPTPDHRKGLPVDSGDPLLGQNLSWSVNHVSHSEVSKHVTSREGVCSGGGTAVYGRRVVRHDDILGCTRDRKGLKSDRVVPGVPLSVPTPYLGLRRTGPDKVSASTLVFSSGKRMGDSQYFIWDLTRVVGRWSR